MSWCPTEQFVLWPYGVSAVDLRWDGTQGLALWVLLMWRALCLQYSLSYSLCCWLIRRGSGYTGVNRCCALVSPLASKMPKFGLFSSAPPEQLSWDVDNNLHQDRSKQGGECDSFSSLSQGQHWQQTHKIQTERRTDGKIQSWFLPLLFHLGSIRVAT